MGSFPVNSAAEAARGEILMGLIDVMGNPLLYLLFSDGY
jgi:hypothetical protein